MFKVFGIIFLLLFLHNVVGETGELCTTKGGKPGKCINVQQCQAAIEDIKKRINPQICSFNGQDPVVCCADSDPLEQVANSSTQRTTTSTQYVSDSACERWFPPIEKTGRKAWDKCIEYQEKYVYPCEKSFIQPGKVVQAGHCGHGADELIVGGVDIRPGEFPHMVLLSFDPSAVAVQERCTGSIISEWFILAAAHCTSSREYGELKYARIGAHKLTDKDPGRLYKIDRIINHPEYKPPHIHNDISLLRTDRLMELDSLTVPACLHTGEPVTEGRVLTVGWGAAQLEGSLADTMRKETLYKLSTAECQMKSSAWSFRKRGFNETTQVCYGHKLSGSTCYGDSGSPIQVESRSIQCMYTLIGVTSLRACGLTDYPGIYTRVAPYTAWIESVVWP